MMRSLRRLAAVMVLGWLAVPLAVAAQGDAATADLDGLKAHMLEHAEKMKAGTAEVLTFAEGYYDLANGENFEYQVLWDEHRTEIVPLLEQARRDWAEDAHGNYELNEGMVAGIPSLSSFDVLIDAGPSGADDPENALDFNLTLPDGRVLEKPGNLFHYLTEPALWGTEDAYVGLRVDMDGDGELELGEALPEANVLLAAAQELDKATADLQQAINDWQPTLDDALTALVVMIPTMSGYFEEWKLSPFVLGDQSTERGFVANSRLLDVLGILGGLQLTYTKVGPLVEETDPAMHTQIQTELDGVVGFVQDLYTREQAGTRYTPEQADQFGNELQTRATSLAGQISQAAALLDITIEEA